MQIAVDGQGGVSSDGGHLLGEWAVRDRCVEALCKQRQIAHLVDRLVTHRLPHDVLDIDFTGRDVIEAGYGPVRPPPLGHDMLDRQVGLDRDDLTFAGTTRVFDGFENVAQPRLAARFVLVAAQPVLAPLLVRRPTRDLRLARRHRGTKRCHVDRFSLAQCRNEIDEELVIAARRQAADVSAYDELLVSGPTGFGGR